MSGFENDVMYAKNSDYTAADNQNVLESNGLATNGQMWIGTTALNAGGTHINVGTLTSPDSSVTIGYSAPNITLQAASSGNTWTNVTGTSQAAQAGASYIANNAGLVTFTLPAVSAVGDYIRIQGAGAGGWIVTPAAGDTIRFLTTPAATSLASTNQYNGVEILCITANAEWVARNITGNLTVV